MTTDWSSASTARWSRWPADRRPTTCTRTASGSARPRGPARRRTGLGGRPHALTGAV